MHLAFLSFLGLSGFASVKGDGNYNISDGLNKINNQINPITFAKRLSLVGSSNKAYAVNALMDGGFVFAGDACENDARNVLFGKLDKDANPLWIKILAVNGSSYAITQNNGGFMMAGFGISHEKRKNNILVAQLSDEGEVLWVEAIESKNSNVGYDINLLGDVGYVLVGETTSFGSNITEALAVCLNVTGGILWAKTFGGGNGDGVYYVEDIDAGGLVIAGYTVNANSNKDALVSRLDAHGEVLWANYFGGVGDDVGCAAIQSIGTGLIVSGYTNSFGSGIYDVLIAKFDEVNGALLWAEAIGESGNEKGHAL